MSKTVVFTFGRLNPMTIGHKKLIDRVISVAKKNRAEPRIYLSHTKDNKKNPLEYRDKVNYLRMGYPEARKYIINSELRTITQIMRSFVEEGVTDVIMVVGSDRVSEFERMLGTYVNHKDPKKSYDLNSFKVVSAGSRDPDADGVSGASASKMRQYVLDNDFESFSKIAMDGLSSIKVKSLFKLLRKEMRLKNEQLNIKVKRFKNF
jgi:hypothetical protein